MNKRVLVVADDPVTRRDLTGGLTGAGYVCTASADGWRAIRELQRARLAGQVYDLLVLDADLADIPGITMAQVLRLRYPGLPLLIVTAADPEAPPADRLRAIDAAAVLPKPVASAELTAALADLPTGSTGKLSEPPPEPPADPGVGGYLALRITATDWSRADTLHLGGLPGVAATHTLRGGVDILLRLSSEAGPELEEQILAWPGLETLFQARVTQPRLDPELAAFTRLYQALTGAPEPTPEDTVSCLLVDLDPTAIQSLFAAVRFLPEVVVCDVLDDGSRLLLLVDSPGPVGRTHPVIARLNRLDGVLRVRDSQVIQQTEP